MTNQQLLIPRYCIYQEYPDMPFQKGEIIILVDVAIDGRRYWQSPHGNHWYEPFFDKFPHLFEKLSWWMCRTEIMMPPYVVDNFGKILEVIWFKNVLGGWRWTPMPRGSGFSGKANEVIPATDAQIAEYLSKK